jgi:hypothetical protein
MIEQQTCPHCGARKIDYVYGCLTVVNNPVDRGRACYRSQLAAQAAEIERYQKVLGDIGDKAHDLSTGPEVWDGYWDIRRMAYDAI